MIKNITSVRIGGIPYLIKHVQDLHDGDAKLDGRISTSLSEINIDGRLIPSAVAQCLLHEMVHAFYIHIGVQDFDEGQVDAIAYQLYATICDNPELFREIMRTRRSA